MFDGLDVVLITSFYHRVLKGQLGGCNIRRPNSWCKARFLCIDSCENAWPFSEVPPDGEQQLRQTLI